MGRRGLGTALTLAALALTGPAQPPRQPTTGEIAGIREQMRALQAQRRIEDARQSILTLAASSRTPPAPIPSGQAALVLVDDLDQLRVVCRLEPAGGGTALQVPLCLKGEQWVTLPPGDWHLTVLAGDPITGRRTRLALGPQTLAPNRKYEIILARNEESQLKNSLKESAAPPREPDPPGR